MNAQGPLNVALIQMRSGLEPAANAEAAKHLIRRAVSEHQAQFVCTPEMTNLVDRNRSRLLRSVKREPGDPTLAAMRALAVELRIWISLGSIAVSAPNDDRAVNRGFLIDPKGTIVARYDKIHLFDVELDGGESYRESGTFLAGKKLASGLTPWGLVGLTVCYDLRFPELYRRLARRGASILVVPSAFTVPTGSAHWEVLLRARAIESGAFVLAAAQGGKHEDGRTTWGRSMIVAPWGEVVAAAKDDEPQIVPAVLDLQDVARARKRIPAWNISKTFEAA